MPEAAVLFREWAGYLKPEDITQLESAYHFSKAAHEGQYRKSGEPYISHPLAVADILAQWHMDPQALTAALLHDVTEDTAVTKVEISKHFGVPVFVSTVPALVFRVYSWFGFLATALVGLVGILAVLAGGRSGDLVAITIIFVAFLAYSLVLRWVSGEMRAANMWAFLIGFVISALGVFGTILALDRLPDGIGNPDWMRYITIAVFTVAGTLAFVGFALRIARRG